MKMYGDMKLFDYNAEKGMSSYQILRDAVPSELLFQRIFVLVGLSDH